MAASAGIGRPVEEVTAADLKTRRCRERVRNPQPGQTRQGKGDKTCGQTRQEKSDRKPQRRTGRTSTLLEGFVCARRRRTGRPWTVLRGVFYALPHTLSLSHSLSAKRARVLTCRAALAARTHTHPPQQRRHTSGASSPASTQHHHARAATRSWHAEADRGWGWRVRRVRRVSPACPPA
eukprot:81454-Rhodomonas_salina.5